MKYFICSALLCLGAVVQTFACNVCGCSAGGDYLGILPQYYDHYVGLQYQFRSFHSEHEPLRYGDPMERSKQYYNTLQLRAHYNLSNRVQLFAFVPYYSNIQQQDGVRTTTSGIGDASVLANVVLLRKDKPNEQWQQLLMAGGGVKLPIGRYEGITVMDREGLPNMQTGTGSWDFITDVNYTLRRKNAGINLDASYTFTTASREQYKYGNRLNSSLLGFYSFNRHKLKLLPQAGFRYEYVLHDYDNYPKKWLNEQTGGHMLFASVGAQAYYNHWGIQAMYHIPLAQHYADGNVTAVTRTEAGILYLF
jgi:hypothetical protein